MSKTYTPEQQAYLDADAAFYVELCKQPGCAPPYWPELLEASARRDEAYAALKAAMNGNITWP
jgi:hypothetical protein